MDHLDDDFAQFAETKELVDYKTTSRNQVLKMLLRLSGLEDEVKRLTAECNAGYFVPEDIHSGNYTSIRLMAN